MAKRTDAPARLARRRFLLAAAAGAAAVATPQVSRAQTVSWRMQSAWPARDVLHEVAVDYARRVAVMTANRLKIDVVAAGAVVPTLQMADAVHTGILHGGHGVATLWSNKHKAFALFGAPPSFGWDSQGFLAWFYNGGGEALYRRAAQRHSEGQSDRLALLSDAATAARLVQEGDQERRRPQGPALSDRGSRRRDVRGARRAGGEPAQQRDRAGHGARPARCDGGEQPGDRPSARHPRRRQVLHDGKPSPAGRGAGGDLQQGAVRRAAGRAEGDLEAGSIFGVERAFLESARRATARISTRSGSARLRLQRPVPSCCRRN